MTGKMEISFCCCRKKKKSRIQAFFASGGNPYSAKDYFYGHMIMKFFSIFKSENKAMYLHLSDNHLDDYQRYLDIVFPENVPNFATINLKTVYKNLPLNAKNPHELIEDLTLGFGIFLA